MEAEKIYLANYGISFCEQKRMKIHLQMVSVRKRKKFFSAKKSRDFFYLGHFKSFFRAREVGLTNLTR